MEGNIANQKITLVKLLTIICAIVIIIGIYLPWLSVIHTLPSIETQPEISPKNYCGWELSTLDNHQYPVVDAVSNFLKITTYLFLIYGIIMLILILSNVQLKNVKFKYLSSIFSILCVILAFINIFEIYSLEGGDIRYEIGYGIFIILLSGIILMITSFWITKHNSKMEND